MTTHELKCWPEYMKLIATGAKTFEVRDCRDRKFKEGDLVRLRGWEPYTEAYTGEPDIWKRIGYVMPPGAWGLPRHKTVFSLLEAEKEGLAK